MTFPAGHPFPPLLQGVPVDTSQIVDFGTRLAKLPQGILGYAEVTANQATIINETDLTGLATTVHVLPSRRVRITASIRVGVTTVSNVCVLRIKEGTTTLQVGDVCPGRDDTQENASLEKSVILESPSTGSHTYKLTLDMGVGTGSIRLTAAATDPAFILVEDIGPSS